LNIITKLNEKIFRKGLDKSKEMWYNIITVKDRSPKERK
jgi:hypothetical protein